MNFSKEFKISHRETQSIKNEEYYHDFAEGVGMKGFTRYFLPYFAHRLQNALPSSKAELDSADVSESIAAVMRYMSEHKFNVLGNAVKLDELQSRYTELSKEWSTT